MSIEINGVYYSIGDRVVVDRDRFLTVGIVDQLDPSDPTGCISLETGGWFGKDGELNVGSWKIIRKATLEDRENLEEY